MNPTLELIPYVGIVEKRVQDDKRVGICKVRAFHHHTADITLLPTDQLPDAYPVEALTTTIWSMPKEGDSVFGYFLDEKKQSMIIVGRVAAAVTNAIKHPEGDGFVDARDNLKDFPRQAFKDYSYHPEHGVTADEMDAALPYPPYGKAGSTTPFLARGKTFPSQIDPSKRRAYAKATQYKTAKGDKWNERENEYGAVYPFNHVYETESLHVMEWDDTPGAERVHLRHRIGTGFEYFTDGSKVEKIVKDNYTVVLGDNWMGVSGSLHIHAMGDVTLLVEGDMTQRVKGNYMLQVDGDYKRLVKGDVITNTEGSAKHSSSGDFIVTTDSTLWFKGSTLQENSSSTPDVDKIEELK